MFKGATLVTFAPPSVEHADIIVADGRIVRKGWRLPVPPETEVVDARGRIIVPGLVDAHVRPAETFGATLPARPADAPGSAPDIDHAHSDETLLCALFAHCVDSLRCGVTTSAAWHHTPSCIPGSLSRHRDVFLSVGLRGTAAYGTNDLAGPEGTQRALAETREGAAWGGGFRFRYFAGVGALDAVGEATLSALADTAKRHETPLHARVRNASDVTRLLAAGLLRPGSLVACDGPIPVETATALEAAGSHLVALPGASGAGAFAHALLGTGAGRPDILEAVRTAMVHGHGGTSEQALEALGRAQTWASSVFGVTLGSFVPGAAADLAVLDYRAATPFNEKTLANHVVQGMGAHHVQHVMVDGKLLVRDRQLTRLDTRNLMRQVQRAALDLWTKLSSAPYPGLDQQFRDENAPPQEMAESFNGLSWRDEDSLPIERLAPASPVGPAWTIRGGDTAEREQVLPPATASRLLPIPPAP